VILGLGRPRAQRLGCLGLQARPGPTVGGRATAAPNAGLCARVMIVVRPAQDIVAGNFKGFALLRQLAMAAPDSHSGGPSSSPPKPMYIRVRPNHNPVHDSLQPVFRACLRAPLQFVGRRL